MQTHVDKNQKNQSHSTVAKATNEQNYSSSAFQFIDNHPEAIQMRKLQEMANNYSQKNSFRFVDNRPEVAQMKRLQELANNSPRNQQLAQLQKMANEHTAKQEPPVQKKVNNTGLPDKLKTGIENLSGYSMDDVKVHYNSDKPAQLQAHAFAQGTDVHVASGQEKHLSHEAWHVVQQKQGRVKPTRQLKGKVNINDDDKLEKEADEMGAKALQMKENDQIEVDSVAGKKSSVSSSHNPIQRYTTKSNGLSVAGELHTKSDEHRDVEKSFASHIKGVEPSTTSYWQEYDMPVTSEESPASSEHPDHFIAWDIDRMTHHYLLIKSVLDGVTVSSESPATFNKVQAAQIALSSKSMLETLDFLGSDLGNRDESFVEVATEYTQMCDEFKSVFSDLLDSAKIGSISERSSIAFNSADFPSKMRVIDQKITELLPDLSGTRGIASYDFTRSVAMNDTANKKKGVKGIWMIGEYHAQEIEQYLGDKIQYDLVSMNDFNADVKAFDESRGGSTIKVDHLGELLTLSRKLTTNLDYFVKGSDKIDNMDGRLAHWDRCMVVLYAFRRLIRLGLAQAQVSEAKLPGGVEFNDLLELVDIIEVGLNKERRATLELNLDSLPSDLYSLMRDPEVLSAAHDLNVLTGLAEFSSD